MCTASRHKEGSQLRQCLSNLCQLMLHVCLLHKSGKMLCKPRQHSTAQHSTAQHSTAQQLLDMAACSCGLLQYHRVAGFEHLCDTAQVVHADLFVSDRFTGWRERVLTNLSELYSQQTRGSPADVSQQMVARVTSSLPMPCKLP